MILYHGTSRNNYEANIKDAGLIPNALKLPENVKTTFKVGSNSHCVYLTNNAYAASYFASMANGNYPFLSGLILKIDTAILDDTQFAPDDNYVRDEEDIEFVVAKELILDRRHMWEQSLSKTHLVAYSGIIPPSCIEIESRL
jgi:hypothetical protein